MPFVVVIVLCVCVCVHVCNVSVYLPDKRGPCSDILHLDRGRTHQTVDTSADWGDSADGC